MQLPNSHHSIGVRLPSPMTPRIGRHRRIAGGREARGCGGWSCGEGIRGTPCGEGIRGTACGEGVRGTACGEGVRGAPCGGGVRGTACGGRIRGTACGAEMEVRGGGAALRGTAAAGGRGTGAAPRVRGGVGPIPFGAGEGSQEPLSRSRYGRRIGTGSAVVSGGWRHPAGRSLRRLIGETSHFRSLGRTTGPLGSRQQISSVHIAGGSVENKMPANVTSCQQICHARKKSLPSVAGRHASFETVMLRQLSQSPWPPPTRLAICVNTHLARRNGSVARTPGAGTPPRRYPAFRPR